MQFPDEDKDSTHLVSRERHMRDGHILSGGNEDVDDFDTTRSSFDITYYCRVSNQRLAGRY